MLIAVTSIPVYCMYVALRCQVSLYIGGVRIALARCVGLSPTLLEQCSPPTSMVSA